MSPAAAPPTATSAPPVSAPLGREDAYLLGLAHDFARYGKPVYFRLFFRWVAAHPRVKMLAYNQGNTPRSPFRLYRYPRAARVMRRALKSTRYTARAASSSS